MKVEMSWFLMAFEDDVEIEAFVAFHGNMFHQ